jgi:hypothetical protein
MPDDNQPRDLTEAERIRIHTARAALAGAMDRDGDSEGREAAFRQFLQTGGALRETLEALHIPDDAGDYAEGLRAILVRIPEGWGRWISCDRGWYPLICELDSALAQLDPDYVVHQCKEKFGTLRFYTHSDRFTGLDSEFQRLIDAAEERSAAICELCGAPGRRHTRSSAWVKTVCAACAEAGGWERIGETVG